MWNCDSYAIIAPVFYHRVWMKSVTYFVRPEKVLFYTVMITMRTIDWNMASECKQLLIKITKHKCYCFILLRIGSLALREQFFCFKKPNKMSQSRKSKNVWIIKINLKLCAMNVYCARLCWIFKIVSDIVFCQLNVGDILIRLLCYNFVLEENIDSSNFHTFQFIQLMIL